MTPVAELPLLSAPRGLRPSLALLLCAAGLAGCAAPPDLPQPQAHAPSTQKTARAVHHWDVLAADVAARTAAKLREWPAGAHPIYVTPVEEPGGVPGFGAGFRSLLITHLVERGLTMATQPSDVRLAVGVQLVQHVAPPGDGARPVLLGEGVRVARDASMENGDYLLAWAPPGPAPVALSGAGAGGATGVVPATVSSGTVASVVLGAPDAARPVVVQRLASGPARTEVLVTTSLESEGRYLARTSDVYSIDQADAALYLPALPAPPPAMGPPPAPVKTWQVVP